MAIHCGSKFNAKEGQTTVLINTLLYKETAQRIELDAMEKLCRLFNCQVSDLFELVDA